jgi:tetratricopeptide (TPR) repeat protein
VTDPGAEEFQRGLALEVEGDIEGASRAYERSMQIAGPKFLWHAGMRLGALRWNADDRAGALASFRTAAAQPSEHQEVPGDAYGWIGYILSKQRHPYDAIVEYQKGADLGNAGCIYGLGCLCEKEDDLRKAVTYYIKADQLGSAEASNRMAVYYEGLQNSAAALAAWERGDDRGDAEAAMNVGYAHMRAGDFDRAIVAIMRAEKRGHPRAPLLLGDLYVRRMAPAKFHKKSEPVQMALAAYGRALANNHVDGSPGAAVRIGRIRYYSHETSVAETALQYAIDSGHSRYAPEAVLWLAALHARERGPAKIAGAYQAIAEDFHGTGYSVDQVLRGPAIPMFDRLARLIRGMRTFAIERDRLIETCATGDQASAAIAAHTLAAISDLHRCAKPKSYSANKGSWWVCPECRRIWDYIEVRPKILAPPWGPPGYITPPALARCEWQSRGGPIALGWLNIAKELYGVPATNARSAACNNPNHEENSG